MASLTADAHGILILCPSCGTKNRQQFHDANRAIRCGRCQAMLPKPSVPVEVPETTAFDSLIARASLPVVVDYWAPWCGPCHAMAPELEKIAQSMAGQAIVAKVNTDALPDLGERFRIRSIPTLIAFQAGSEVGRSSGARPAQDIAAFIRSVLPQSSLQP